MRARRVDANLASIVDAYRAMGCTVYVDNGMVDIWVGYGGICELAEIKDGSKPPSARKYTKAQIEFRKWWTGGVRLVQSLDDVTVHVSNIRQRHRDITAAAVGRVYPS